MASEVEVHRRILAAIQQKTGGQKPCVLCGHTAWVLAPGYSVMPIINNPERTGLHVGGPILPNTAMVCAHCGNTHFINLIALGFGAGDLASLQIDEDGAAKP